MIHKREEWQPTSCKVAGCEAPPKLAGFVVYEPCGGLHGAFVGLQGVGSEQDRFKGLPVLTEHLRNFKIQYSTCCSLMGNCNLTVSQSAERKQGDGHLVSTSVIPVN